MLLEENGNNHNYLEHRIQNQLLAERQEHNKIMREQQQLRQTRVENYETNIDDYEAEKRLIEQRSQQPRSTGLTHSFYSSDEDPYDIEMEFQRRLQLENERVSREKRIADFEPDEIQRIRNEREKRVEQERKLQLMIDDHDRRSANRVTERNKSSVSDVNDSQRRMERGSATGQNQRKQSTEDEWFAMQRKNHLDKRRDQENLRREQSEAEEQERQRKLKDIRYQKEQEQKMMDEYQKQKELRESRERQQQQPPYNDRRGNSEDKVKNEFKQKAMADYERRRETLDKEIERAEREKRIRSLNVKPPQVANKPNQRSSVYDDDEPAPPRPPPPSGSLSPSSAGRSPSSTSPQPSRGDRFSFSQKTVTNYNSYANARQSTTSPSGRMYSPTSQYQQPRSGSSSRSPSREDPAQLDFRQKMKLFGVPEKVVTSNDIRSTFSKKQREYMD